MLTALIVAISILLLIHAVFNLLTMIFSWNDPYTLHLRKSPNTFIPPKKSFSLLVPARNEATVIEDTLLAMDAIRYPKNLFEVIVLCRTDDPDTISEVRHTLQNLPTTNIKLEIVSTKIDNKPKALNHGLQLAQGEVISVFDAEDEPHPDILAVINTLMKNEERDVIQSGVQLMNYETHWFSALNVLEYYFWFKSALHFFTKFGVVPLGGNTVFIKKDVLKKINGWDEHKLTEDADLGIRLSLIGANISIVYDEQHVTKEETPSTVAEFIKQRTRWNLGFLQIFFNFKWLQLDGIKKKLLTAYILGMPLLQVLWLIYLPLTMFALFFLQMPIGWALISVLPAYVLVVQFVLYNYGIFQFTREYKRSYNPLIFFKLLLTYFPYQLMLCLAAFRAMFRLSKGQLAWEKTSHLNTHRDQLNA